MGHKIEKSKLKYAVLNKETQQISIYTKQIDVANLLNVSRKTIYRGLPYESSKYIVYIISNVP